jgi:hypothetical protein
MAPDQRGEVGDGGDQASAHTAADNQTRRPRSRLSARLLRSDIVRLPAIALATWLVVGMAGEGLARLYYAEQQQDRCQIFDMTGGSFAPNCHSRIKMFESTWVDNDYNDCGYRSAHSCRTREAGSLRIAVMGTSVSRGLWLSYDESVVGRMEHTLSIDCRRPVDVQNVALADTIWDTPTRPLPLWHHIADRLGEAITLRPDAVVLVLSPFDLANYISLQDLAPAAGKASPVEPSSSLRSFVSNLLKQTKDFFANESRFILVARHYAYRDDQRYLTHEIGRVDASDYLRPPFSPAWTLRLKVADDTIGRMADQAKAAGLPFIVALMPHRPQAMLSVLDADRHDTDPLALGDALRQIAIAHHAQFVDVTKSASQSSKPGDLFFVINGHPTDQGDATLASAVGHEIEINTPSFSSCNPLGWNRPGSAGG